MRGSFVQTAFVLFTTFSHLATFLLAIILILRVRLSHLPTEHYQVAGISDMSWDVIEKAILALAVSHCTLYLYVPNFDGYVEPMIPLLASNYLHGAPVYADWNAGQAVVGSDYGPYVFIAQIPVLLWYPTIAASKLVGIIFGLGAILLSFFVVRSRVRSPGTATAMCACMVAMLFSQGYGWFWNRPDPMLIALVALGTLLLDRVRPATCLVILGFLTGVAVNLKLFGPIYLLPLALACIPRIRSWTGVFGAAAIGGSLCLAAVALPFCIGFSSLSAYIGNLRMAADLGYDAGASEEAAFYGLTILALPLLMLPGRRITQEVRILVTALSICTAIVAVIAGNPGGGPSYMMPLTPAALYLAVRLSEQHPVEQRRETCIRRALLCAVMICAAPSWTYSLFRMGRQLPFFEIESAKATELRGLFAAYPASEMGHNLAFDTASDEFYRVEKAFLGQVTRFDYVNYADQHAAGLPPSVLYPLFDNCRIPSWILPKQGAPFLGTDFYGHPLLDQGALQRFAANYELAEQHDFYAVWRCASDVGAASTIGR